MGADFNILEYADPEALPGEKTNILDIELEEEPIKNEKKVKVELPKAPGKPNIANQLKKEAVPPVTSVISAPQSLANNIHPPPLAISQAQTNHPLGTGITTHLTPQQIHQQMLHQVQQAAAHGKPMPPGSRLQTPDGFVGIVTPNNNVQLQLPQGYHQRLLVTQCKYLLISQCVKIHDLILKSHDQSVRETYKQQDIFLSKLFNYQINF